MYPWYQSVLRNTDDDDDYRRLGHRHRVGRRLIIYGYRYYYYDYYGVLCNTEK